MKTLTELADDLHVMDPVHGSISRKARAAMPQIEAELRKAEAERMKHLCPVCGGTKLIEGMTVDGGKSFANCPDGCDGYITWRRLFAVVGGLIDSDLAGGSPENLFREYLLTSQLRVL